MFSIANRQLKLTTAEDIQPHVEAFLATPAPTSIDLSGNTIGIDAAGALAAAIKSHGLKLTTVNLADVFTGRLNTEIPAALDHLFPALLACGQLTRLDLSDNAFGLQAIDPIEAYLAKAVTLEHLILNNNGMGPFAGARIGRALFDLAVAKQAAGQPSLKTFMCGRNRLENGLMEHLSIGLRNHKDLHTIRLYQNGIRPQGIATLVRSALVRLSKLTVVDLQDNTLTRSASVALAGVLPKWTQLVELNLNDCLMGPKGLQVVVEALKNALAELAVVKLQYNEMEEEALKVFIDTVHQLPGLQSVELNGNRFEEDGALVEKLVEKLEAHGAKLDDLDDLEEVDSDEEEDSGDEEEEEEREGEIDQLEKEWRGKVEEDAEVNQLADGIAKVEV